MHPPTQSLEKVLSLASLKAGALGTDTVSAPCLLVAVAVEGTSLAAKLLKGEGLTADVIERTAKNLFGAWQEGEGLKTAAQPRIGRDVQNMMEAVEQLVQKSGHTHVTPTHVLYYLVRNAEAQKVLKAAWLSLDRANPKNPDTRTPDQKLKSLTTSVDDAIKTNVNGLPDGENAISPTIDLYTVDLTKLAREKKIDPIVGRKKEIRRAIEILGRQTKNNPVFLGEPGVGKTAIAEGLAIEIAEGRVPKSLKDKRLLRLDLTALVAGTTFRGQFEERIKQLLVELGLKKDTIVFIDELHTLIGAGAAVGAMDAANVLKPALARGELTCIGATTLSEYRKYIEKDGALNRRFQPVMVEPSTVEETIQILRGRSKKLEEHHGVKITDEALVLSAMMADRYISDRVLPDKAIDVVDETASALAIDNPGGTVVNDHVMAKISQMTGIKLDKLGADEAVRLSKMEGELHKRVISQDMAISAVSRAVRRARAGLKDAKTPIGNFLFLGPTGVGKTELSRALQEFLFDDDRTLIRIDMSEFMEKHSVSKLIGAPPGYVGYEEGGRLTEAVRRKPYCVVLLDEIEKAHPDVFNILLQVMDDGRLTDGQGRTVDFKNTIIIMTSNIAADKLIEFVMRKHGDCTHEELLDQVMPTVKLVFRPEFLNRLDEVVCFLPLSEDDIVQVLELTLVDLRKRLDASHKVGLDLTDESKEIIVTAGYDAKYGARPMKRAVRRLLEDPLSEDIIGGRIPDGCTVSVRAEGSKLFFAPAETMSAEDNGGGDAHHEHDSTIVSSDVQPAATPDAAKPAEGADDAKRGAKPKK